MKGEIIMKLGHLVHKTFSMQTLAVIVAILFALCVGPADSAIDSKTITIVLSAEPENLDPGSAILRDVGKVLMRNVVETLTEVSIDDSSIMPRLATSWKQIEANTWHFFLRKGVKFHDGADFNAEAVMLNINNLYDKKIDPGMIGKRYFVDFKMECRALDSHALEIKTDKVQPLLPTLLAILTIRTPKTPLNQWTKNPIGTGPYKFVEWAAGKQIILERFDGYWGKLPQIEKAVYVWRTESAVRAAMVEIGEADLAPDIAIQDVKRSDMDFGYFNTLVSLLRIGGEWEPPLNDRRVRMALNYAVDRNAIRGSILSKDVVPATQMLMPNIFGYNPNLKVWPYDPQKARELLAEARKDGVPVDKEIFLAGRMGTYPGAEELMEAITSMYKAVGFSVKVKMLETGVYRRYDAKPFAKNVGPYLVQKNVGNNPGDAGFTVYYSYHCKGVSSATCDKKLDDLIDKAMVATGEVRKNLWQAAFKYIQEDIIPNVMLFQMVDYARVGKRINFKPSIVTSGEIQLAQITFKQ